MRREPSDDSAMNGKLSSDFHNAKGPETGGLNRFDGRCASRIEKIDSRHDFHHVETDHLSGWTGDDRDEGAW
jgi:hypothetical protein